MNNEDQNELLELLQDKGINAVIQPSKEGPNLSVFLKFPLKDWDHKALYEHVISLCLLPK